jgi:hypothetical protein
MNSFCIQPCLLKKSRFLIPHIQSLPWKTWTPIVLFPLEKIKFQWVSRFSRLQYCSQFYCNRLIIIELKRSLQSFIEQSDLFVRQYTDEMGQHRLGEAYQSITVNTAVMFQPLIDPDRNLCGEVLVRSVHGRADNR